jgi:hypothetical protein
MVRIQRLDYENQKFPVVLMFLFVLTSLGTISFIFFGHRPVTIPESKSIPRFHNGAIGSEDLQTVIFEQPLISTDSIFSLYSDFILHFYSADVILIRVCSTIEISNQIPRYLTVRMIYLHSKAWYPRM